MLYEPFQEFRRLETVRLEAAASDRVRFTTEAGPLDIAAYAPGVLRLRAGGPVGPDYGLLASPPDPGAATCTELGGAYRIDAGSMALEIAPRPLRIRMFLDGEVVLESTGDGHIRGGPRIPPVGVRDSTGWLLALGLESGEAVYGLGEKYGPLNRRGQRVVSWNEDAWGVNAEASYKNVPFAWSPRGWGVYAHTTSRVVHGVGYPAWSHRSYILQWRSPPSTSSSLPRAPRPGCWSGSRTLPGARPSHPAGASGRGCLARITAPPTRPSRSRARFERGGSRATCSSWTGGPGCGWRPGLGSSGIPTGIPILQGSSGTSRRSASGCACGSTRTSRCGARSSRSSPRGDFCCAPRGMHRTCTSGIRHRLGRCSRHCPRAGSWTSPTPAPTPGTATRTGRCSRPAWT